MSLQAGLKNLVIISIGWDLITWETGKWGLLLAVQLCAHQGEGGTFERTLG